MGKACRRTASYLAPRSCWFREQCPQFSEAACEALLPGRSGTEREDCCRCRFAAIPPVEIVPISTDRQDSQQPPQSLFLLAEYRWCCSYWRIEQVRQRLYPNPV